MAGKHAGMEDGDREQELADEFDLLDAESFARGAVKRDRGQYPYDQDAVLERLRRSSTYGKKK